MYPMQTLTRIPPKVVAEVEKEIETFNMEWTQTQNPIRCFDDGQKGWWSRIVQLKTKGRISKSNVG